MKVIKEMSGNANIFFYPPAITSDQFLMIGMHLPFFYQPNRTIAGVQSLYSQQLSVLEATCGFAPHPIGNSPELGRENYLSILQYNGIGKLLMSSTNVPLYSVQDRCSRDAQVEKVVATFF